MKSAAKAKAPQASGMGHLNLDDVQKQVPEVKAEPKASVRKQRSDKGVKRVAH